VRARPPWCGQWRTLTVRTIELYCSLNAYDWQAFRLVLIEAAAYVPCLLCGELHGLRIHAVLLRKVRSPESGENTEITIISIICRRAKRRGRQYTKRLLPPFVNPYCQITREGVLAYLRRFPDGSISYRLAFSILGARDMRTIRRHLVMGLGQIAEAALRLAALLSEVPTYASVPERRLGQSDCLYLEQLVQQTDRGRQRAGVGAKESIPSVIYLHLVGLFRPPCRPLAPSLTSVLRAVVFHDTS